MASGKIHDRVTLLFLLPIILSLQRFFLLELKEIVFFTFGFLFAGLMFGPDLDTKSVQYKRWGFLRFIWKPYQKLGGHRSFLNQSHDSLLGPFLRVVYLACLLSLLTVILIYFLNLFFDKKYLVSELFKLVFLEIAGKKKLLLFLSGIWLGSFSHHLTDWFYELKRFLCKKLASFFKLF